MGSRDVRSLDRPPVCLVVSGGWSLAVDVGTSNTAAAYRVAGGVARAVRLTDQADQMPSAVLVAPDGVKVGLEAVRSAPIWPAGFESAPKSRMGEGERWLGGRDVSDVSLVAAVLGQVVARAQRAAGGTPPERVVLTHPVKWAAFRRRVLVKAAAVEGTVVLGSIVTDPVSGEVSQHAEVAIGLPDLGVAAPAVVTDDGSVIYEDDSGLFDIVIQAVEDGARISTILRSSQAPGEYAYPVNPPPGSVLEIAPHGGVIGRNAQKDLIAELAPPWAKDANGAVLSPHYRIDGTTLVQVVAHQSTAVTYPVVADPGPIWAYCKPGYLGEDWPPQKYE